MNSVLCRINLLLFLAFQRLIRISFEKSNFEVCTTHFKIKIKHLHLYIASNLPNAVGGNYDLQKSSQNIQAIFERSCNFRSFIIHLTFKSVRI